MKYIIIILCMLLSCCNNFKELEILSLDITPPLLYGINVINQKSISISSNENIFFIEDSFISKDNFDIASILSSENLLTITFKNNMVPGKEYISEFRIEDKNGNSLSFIASYYGFNPELPKLLINEFICEGTKTNPNKIELYVLEGGNMAGITIYNGVSNNYDSSFIFPEIKVAEGEYIVVRTISDKYSRPFIEIEDLDINHDKKFIPGVRDLRIPNFKFSGSNGVLSIYDNPFGNIIDCVIYTKNLNDDSKNNRNFGLSKTVDRIDEVAIKNEWVNESGVLFPEDVIHSDDSTTTRSINRYNFTDKNNKEDWYIVKTKKASFGYKNSLDKY